MAYAATAFQGTKFQIGSPLVDVDGVLELPGLKEQKDEIDCTAIDDTEEYFIADPLVKRQPFTLTVAFDVDNTQHMALVSAYTGGTTVAGKLTMSDGETLTGTFLVLAIEQAGGKGQASKRIFTMRPTGTLVRA